MSAAHAFWVVLPIALLLVAWVVWAELRIIRIERIAMRAYETGWQNFSSASRLAAKLEDANTSGWGF